MSRSLLTRLFWLALTLTCVVMVELALIDTHIKTATAPLGIVSYEFCGFTHNCDAMLNNWNAKQQQWLMLSLGFDYLFMLLYPATFFLALLLLANKITGPLKILTIIIAWLSWGAGLFDAIENTFLIEMLLNNHSDLAQFAAIAATIKFAIVILALLWLLWTYPVYVLRKPVAAA